MLSQFVAAQETLKAIKNDIGFNTNFILNGIFNSGSNPFSFVYKRQLTEQRAWRSGVSFNVNINSISGQPTNYSQQTFYSINPSIGKEWQLSLSKRWICCVLKRRILCAIVKRCVASLLVIISNAKARFSSCI